jgi:RNA polymerase sigma-70 factor (ECF subfamily)
MSTPDPQSWLEEHGSALYSFAMLYLHDSHRAEDMVQETLLAALQAWARFRGDCAVRSWLTGILKHKILDEFRRQEREAGVASDAGAHEDPRPAESTEFTANGHWREPVADWGNPDCCLGDQRFWDIIEHCLASMSPRAGRLFVLRELWGWETDEVCKELQMTPSNLWTSLYRTRLAMRRCLERHDIAGVSDHA